jgi:hypothetical protein
MKSLNKINSESALFEELVREQRHLEWLMKNIPNGGQARRSRKRTFELRNELFLGLKTEETSSSA